jgi:hypothetical protein
MNEAALNPDEIVQKALSDHQYFIETFISIKDKDRYIVPFVFNPIQKMFYSKYVELNNEGVDRHIILKPRQLGFTTLICALFLTECILVPNTTAAIIAHDAESTARIFEITKLMYEKLPDEIRPAKRYSSKREIVFEDIGSKIFIGTAGSVGFGRGTTINLLHASEYAFWERPEELMPSLLETVPKSGIIIYETTANGYNHFHTDYTNAKNTSALDRKLNQIPYPHFYRWFDHPEYFYPLEKSEEQYIIETLTDDEKLMINVHHLSHEQIAWRRSKQASLKDKFVQEYPEDDATCFISSGRPFFDAKIIKSIILWNEQGKTWDKKNNQGVIIEPGWSKKQMDDKITIYKEFKQGETYVACADPAEGNPQSDNSTAYILRLNKDPIFVEFCAEIADKLTMPKFYKLLYHMCAQYNFPKLVIERNNHGHLLNYWATNGYLQDQIKILDKYPSVYFAKDGKPGFVSSSVTRPLILDTAAEALRNNMLVIYSKTWLDQALSFVYGPNGKPQASEGKHDDSIIAAAVGGFVLMNERNSSSFSFVNKDAFGIGVSDTQQKPSVYDRQKLLYDDNYLHPLDHNITVGDPETIDWMKYITTEK